MLVAYLATIIALALGSVQIATAPKLPFFDQGACPFECCQYSEWTAALPQQAYSTPRRAADIAFTLRPGENVQALTGVLTTRKSGIVMLRKQAAFSDLTMSAGETLFVLHLSGKGVTLFWYKGATHSGELYAGSVHKGNTDYPWDVLCVP